MSKPTPKPLGIFICDTVIDDRATNKKSLIGIFNSIHASTVPARHQELHVFIALTDGYGQYKSRIICRHRDTGVAVFAAEGDIQFDDPNQVVELNFGLHGLVFKEFGVHDFDFYCDDLHIVSRKFTVNQATGS